MSGITAAQYLKRTVGVVVHAKIEDNKTYCIVKQGDKQLSKQLDDSFGTLSWLTCEKLFNLVADLKRARRKYPVPPASHFFTGFDPNVIKDFDLAHFVDEILPKLQGKTNIVRIAEQYKGYDFSTTNEAEKYEIYDWIVRVWVELRKMKWEDAKISIPEGVVATPVMQALMNLKEARFVDVPAGLESLIPALQAVHPNCTKIDGVWVMDPSECETDPLGLSDATFTAIDMDYSPVDGHSGAPPPVGQEVNALHRTVIHCLTHPYQGLKQEHKEFIEHGGNKDVLDVSKGGVGRNKLVGLGKICGEGTVEECVVRVYDHLKISLLASFSPEQVMSLAAGRIARMSSEKKVVNKEGVWYIKQRN